MGKKNKQPAPPFITSTLQQEASRKLGFQAKRTMKAAQELYEGVEIAGMGAVGLITYCVPTRCVFPEDAVQEAVVHRRPLGQELSAREAALLQGARQRAGRLRGDPPDVRCIDAEGCGGVADEGPIQAL